MKKFAIKILTPDRVAFAGEVEMLHLPTASGPYTLLANSYPFIVMAEYGNLWIQIDGERIDYALSGGILIVKKDVTTVLAEAVERADEIDVDRALAAKERAEARLIKRTAEIDMKRAQAALVRSLNRLNIAGVSASSDFRYYQDEN